MEKTPAQIMQEQYDEFSAEYWTKHILPQMDKWIGNDKEGDAPNVSQLMDDSRQYAWAKLSKIYQRVG